MRRPAAILCTLLAAGIATAGPPSYTADARPLLAAACDRCHNADKAEGGVSLVFPDDRTALAKRKLWKRALARVAGGEMPPEGEKPLAPAEKQKLVAWLAAASDHLDCAPARRDPGPPPMRRLTRAEYRNTVRDLLGVDADPRREFGMPDEDPGDGRFDNLSAFLRVSPALMDKYFTAADHFARVVAPPDGPGRSFRNRLGVPQEPARQTRDAARQALAGLARRAYRRPPADADVDRLLGFYDRARAAGGSFDDGIAAAVKPVLVSPQFLFRVEEDRPAAGDAPGVPVDDHELAVRLSYFLWSTMPDDELARLADQKKLSDPAVLSQQTARMLKDGRAAALTGALATHWLGLREFAKARPTTEFFPAFGPGLRLAMSEELRLFADHLRGADRPVTDLLDADYTFANEELAKHYGIAGVTGGRHQQVALRPEHHRGGLLGMGAVLAGTSHTFRTSPTLRGKYVLANLLGSPPPPPPPDAGQLAEEDPKGKKTPASFREQLARHATQASCVACHKKIDPLGFALDNFDAVGAWREGTGDAPLDVSGELPGGVKVDGYAGLKGVLLSRKDDFARTAAAKVLEYALGRELDGADDCAVRDAVEAMKKDQYRFSALVAEIVRSVPFRQRRAAGRG